MAFFVLLNHQAAELLLVVNVWSVFHICEEGWYIVQLWVGKSCLPHLLPSSLLFTLKGS